MGVGFALKRVQNKLPLAFMFLQKRPRLRTGGEAERATCGNDWQRLNKLGGGRHQDAEARRHGLAWTTWGDRSHGHVYGGANGLSVLGVSSWW